MMQWREGQYPSDINDAARQMMMRTAPRRPTKWQSIVKAQMSGERVQAQQKPRKKK